MPIERAVPRTERIAESTDSVFRSGSFNFAISWTCFAVTVPTVVASGDSQFNRQQDQTNASLLSLGGGTREASGPEGCPHRRSRADDTDYGG